MAKTEGLSRRPFLGFPLPWRGFCVGNRTASILACGWADKGKEESWSRAPRHLNSAGDCAMVCAPACAKASAGKPLPTRLWRVDVLSGRFIRSREAFFDIPWFD